MCIACYVIVMLIGVISDAINNNHGSAQSESLA